MRYLIAVLIVGCLVSKGCNAAFWRKSKDAVIIGNMVESEATTGRVNFLVTTGVDEENEPSVIQPTVEHPTPTVEVTTPTVVVTEPTTVPEIKLSETFPSLAGNVVENQIKAIIQTLESQVAFLKAAAARHLQPVGRTATAVLSQARKLLTNKPMFSSSVNNDDASLRGYKAGFSAQRKTSFSQKGTSSFHSGGVKKGSGFSRTNSVANRKPVHSFGVNKSPTFSHSPTSPKEKSSFQSGGVKKGSGFSRTNSVANRKPVQSFGDKKSPTFSRTNSVASRKPVHSFGDKKSPTFSRTNSVANRKPVHSFGDMKSPTFSHSPKGKSSFHSGVKKTPGFSRTNSVANRKPIHSSGAKKYPTSHSATSLKATDSFHNNGAQKAIGFSQTAGKKMAFHKSSSFSAVSGKTSVHKGVSEQDGEDSTSAEVYAIRKQRIEEIEKRKADSAPKPESKSYLSRFVSWVARISGGDAQKRQLKIENEKEVLDDAIYALSQVVDYLKSLIK